MAKVVTLGEIMLRLSPPLYNKIQQASTFDVNYGGGEANVAVALSYFGHDSYFVTKLPSTPLGDSALRYLRGHNINTNFISRGGENIGIYFLEMGYGGRPSQVLYNRKHSGFAELSMEDTDWEQIFKEVDLFHVSGITLAINENVRKVAMYAMEKAKQLDTKISFDCNYRSKLWTIEEAKPIFDEVLHNVDVCFASYLDATRILGFKPGAKYDDVKKEHEDVLEQMRQHYNIRYIFGTDREVFSANENKLSSFVITDEKSYYSNSYSFKIVDRVGGGDAFASGVIHKLLCNYENYQNAAEFGLATSVLKHTLQGDACILSEQEVEKFIKTSGKGAIGR